MSQEKEVQPLSGWVFLMVVIAMLIGAVYLFISGIRIIDGPEPDTPGIWLVILSVFTLMLGIFLSIGFLVLQPNEAAVLLLFGKYKGSVKQNGFWWANPLLIKKKVSMRFRTLNGQKLKVNDHAGNPIEIAAVVVWQVSDTFAAILEVDDYALYGQERDGRFLVATAELSSPLTLEAARALLPSLVFKETHEALIESV